MKYEDFVDEVSKIETDETGTSNQWALLISYTDDVNFGYYLGCSLWSDSRYDEMEIAEENIVKNGLFLEQRHLVDNEEKPFYSMTASINVNTKSEDMKEISYKKVVGDVLVQAKTIHILENYVLLEEEDGWKVFPKTKRRVNILISLKGIFIHEDDYEYWDIEFEKFKKFE